jgi:D-alanine-D-alanine ligase
MKKIAVIAGGDSGEYDISVKSGAIVAQNIPKDKYEVYLIEIKGERWIYKDEKQNIYSIDKNDFSLSINEHKITFNAVFNAIHGTPGEDGKILAYFEMLGIPFTSTGSISSAITFNKAYCNHIIRSSNNVSIANSIHLIKGYSYSEEDILKEIQLPCFVKPNQGGSSVGMSKVNNSNELNEAIIKAFNEDTEVIIEEYIEGRELTIGVFKYKNEKASKLFGKNIGMITTKLRNKNAININMVIKSTFLIRKL